MPSDQQGQPDNATELDAELGVVARCVDGLVITIMGLLVLVVLWGVISRFVVRDPSQWTEEAARFLMIWLTFLGGAAAFARWEHLGLDWFVGKFDEASRGHAQIISALTCTVFSAAALVYGGGSLVTKTLRYEQVTPAMGFLMGYVYLVVPISGLLICWFSASRAWRLLRRPR